MIKRIYSSLLALVMVVGLLPATAFAAVTSTNDWDIFDAEEHLQAARRLYNSNASLYNQRINTFPYLLLAKLHGMKEAKFYTVEEKKKDFKLQF